MYITYEIGIGGNYSKTSLKLLFHVATNNPALFSLREGTQYYDEHDNLMIEKENEGMDT